MSQASGTEVQAAGFWPPVPFVPQCRTASTLAPALASMFRHVVAFAYQVASQEAP